MEAKTKSKSKKAKPGIDTDAVPEHILNMVRNVEKKAKISKKNHEKNKQNCQDSISLIRNMMGSVRTNIELTAADDDLRAAKEKDIAMIGSARDIFKSMEETNAQDASRSPQMQRQTVKLAKDIDWMAEMPSSKRDDELKKRRAREMEMMRAARHMTQEEEERWVASSATKGNEVKRQREMELELMKMARAQAIEEENMLEEETKRSGRRELSPGLEAARGANRRAQEEDLIEQDERRRGRKAASPGLEAAKHCMKKDFVDGGVERIEELKHARQREMEEIKRARARAEIEEREERQEMMRQERDQERARELNEMREEGGGGQIKQRYNPEDNNSNNQRSQTFAKAPRSKALRSDCWMKQSSESKEDEMKLEKQRELEEMKMARAQAIDEEEQERMEMETMKREEAMIKAREMAMLVAELQRMRRDEPQDAEGQEKLTGYQEEMLTRVMELATLSRDGILTVQ